MTFSKEEKHKIIDALNLRGVNKPCPRCGATKVAIEDGYYKTPVTDKIGGDVKTYSSTSIATMCKNCGFMAFHSLNPLGLLSEK